MNAKIALAIFLFFAPVMSFAQAPSPTVILGNYEGTFTNGTKVQPVTATMVFALKPDQTGYDLTMGMLISQNVRINWPSMIFNPATNRMRGVYQRGDVKLSLECLRDQGGSLECDYYSNLLSHPVQIHLDRVN